MECPICDFSQRARRQRLLNIAPRVRPPGTMLRRGKAEAKHALRSFSEVGRLFRGRLGFGWRGQSSFAERRYVFFGGVGGCEPSFKSGSNFRGAGVGAGWAPATNQSLFACAGVSAAAGRNLSLAA